jgi:hypothetical protein
MPKDWEPPIMTTLVAQSVNASAETGARAVRGLEFAGEVLGCRLGRSGSGLLDVSVRRMEVMSKKLGASIEGMLNVRRGLRSMSVKRVDTGMPGFGGGNL